MGAGGMNPQKLMTSIVGDVAPDVIQQDRFTIADWASRHAFLPLDDFIKRDLKTDPKCPHKEDYYPAAWAEASYGGQVFGIPIGADDRILYYNKKIFREKADALRAAGLDPDRAPRTWSELLAYSKILTERKNGQLTRVGFMPNFGNSWLYLYAFQNNAKFMSDDGRTCTLDTPRSEKALQFMVDGYDLLGGYEECQKFGSGFMGNANDAFMIGKVAMKIDGNWILNDMSRYHPEIELGVAPPPVPDDRYYKRGDFKDEKDQFVSWIGGFCLAMPKGARNTEDAWQYIKFASSTEAIVISAEAQQAWEKHRGRTYIPLVYANAKVNEVIFNRFRPGDEKFARAVKEHIDLMKVGQIRPATFVGQLLWNNHQRAFEQAAYHKASPKQALMEAQASVQRELNAFFGQDKYPVINLQIPMFIGIALGVLCIIGCVIAFMRMKLGRLARSEAKWAYLFIAPWLVGFIVFTAGPMLASLFFSFTKYDVLNEARWVGLNNFADVAGSDSGLVMKGLANAIYLAAVGVPLGLATGLAVALLLNTATRGMRFYRTFFYMPAIVPGVASAVLWGWVLTPDPNKGLINSIWQQTITPWLHAAPPAWLNSADWAKPALVVMGMWGAGSGMILWLAGLKGVPGTLYEAASLDGANPRQQFWSVTFPMLSPIVFFNMVMGFIGAMQEFDRIYIMKPGSDGSTGPDDSLLVPVFHLFNNAFTFFKMGYASALAWMIFAIILGLTFFQFKLAPRWVHYETDK